jgi:hypothetical protein
MAAKKKIEPKKKNKLKTEDAVRSNIVKMKDLLKIYPVCRKTIERWASTDDDQMPHMKVNGRYFFDLQDVTIWMQKHGYGSSEAS